ncbi:amine oxidase [Mucilaginibacter sp. PAMB04168]|uniref:amine oxidase n=1 Tax=Mucilaginibacter sp. PAMB04168 TaxID=3138567 RepID=UPI0031F6C716
MLNSITYAAETSPFHSFWMAGYECSDKLNLHRKRVDLLTETGHLQHIDSDYLLLKPFGIKTVREGIRWSVVETEPYKYDWLAVEQMLQSGKRNGIQQVWDICHFGFPDDLDPFHPDFSDRFVALCCAFVKFYRSQLPDDALIVTPINEVSYLSWLGGECGGTAPYCAGKGWDVKYQLMRAYIKGVAAMKELDPTIRILTTEPLVNMVPPLNATDEEIEEALKEHELQYQAVDMLCGRICPELGGKPEYADLLGFNFYYNNQWIIGQQGFLPWANLEPDPRWRSLSSLLKEAHERYSRPVLLTETSHSGTDRPNWITFIAKECQLLLEEDFPLWGVCLYPIIDRPDWDNLSYWHHSGLWDRVETPDHIQQRMLHLPYAEALQDAVGATNAIINRSQSNTLL